MVPKGNRFWMCLQLQYNALQTFCTIHFAAHCTNLWHIAIPYKAVAFGFKAFLAIAFIVGLTMVLRCFDNCFDHYDHPPEMLGSFKETSTRQLHSHQPWASGAADPETFGFVNVPWGLKLLGTVCEASRLAPKYQMYQMYQSPSPAAATNIFQCMTFPRFYDLQPLSSIIFHHLQMIFRPKNVILDVSGCEVLRCYFPVNISLAVERNCHQSLRQLPHAKFEVSKWRC